MDVRLHVLWTRAGGGGRGGEASECARTGKKKKRNEAMKGAMLKQDLKGRTFIVRWTI